MEVSAWPRRNKERCRLIASFDHSTLFRHNFAGTRQSSRRDSAASFGPKPPRSTRVTVQYSAEQYCTLESWMGCLPVASALCHSSEMTKIRTPIGSKYSIVPPKPRAKLSIVETGSGVPQPRPRLPEVLGLLSPPLQHPALLLRAVVFRL